MACCESVEVTEKVKAWQTLLVLSIVFAIVFTILDFVVHQQLESIKVVPQNYYLNKILISSILFFVILKFANKINVLWQSLFFTFVLNISYYYTTTMQFYWITFVEHFIILAGMFWLIKQQEWSG